MPSKVSAFGRAAFLEFRRTYAEKMLQALLFSILPALTLFVLLLTLPLTDGLIILLPFSVCAVQFMSWILFDIVNEILIKPGIQRIRNDAAKDLH